LIPKTGAAKYSPRIADPVAGFALIPKTGAAK